VIYPIGAFNYIPPVNEGLKFYNQFPQKNYPKLPYLFVREKTPPIQA